MVLGTSRVHAPVTSGSGGPTMASSTGRRARGLGASSRCCQTPPCAPRPLLQGGRCVSVSLACRGWRVWAGPATHPPWPAALCVTRDCAGTCAPRCSGNAGCSWARGGEHGPHTGDLDSWRGPCPRGQRCGRCSGSCPSRWRPLACCHCRCSKGALSPVPVSRGRDPGPSWLVVARRGQGRRPT